MLHVQIYQYFSTCLYTCNLMGLVNQLPVLQRTCLISSSASGTTIRTAQWRAAPISVPTVRGRDTEALVGAPTDSVLVNRPPWNLIRNAI